MTGSKLQKAVYFDTNNLNAAGSYRISPMVVAAMKLRPNEIVTAIMDDEEWDAMVVSDDNQWGLEIVSESREFSAERSQGYYEGFWWGCYYQQVFLSKALTKLGLDEPIMRQVCEGLGITVDKDTGV
jgi:hypothetical protein